MQRYVFLFLFLAICLLSGCRTPKPVSSVGGIEYMTIGIWASTDLAQPGETVRFIATLSNEGTSFYAVELKDRAVMDMIITVNNVATRWSDGKPLTSELTRLELKPGESKSIEMDYVVNKCCESLRVTATFIFSEKLADFLVPPQVMVFIGSYPHGVLP